MTPKTPAICLLLLLLPLACQTDESPPALELATCSTQESPRELLRIENQRDYRPYDIVDAVAVVGDSDEYGGARLVDNCGGEPITLENSYGLLSAAAYVDGQVVLCRPNSAFGTGDGGIWSILESGAPGENLDLGTSCSSGYASSFGFVTTENGLVQYFPDGSSRAVPAIVRPKLTWLGDAGVVRNNDGELVVLPPGGADAIEVEGIPPIEFVVTQGSASSWVFLAVYAAGSSPTTESQLGFPTLYALDLESGSWFETTAVPGDDLRSRNFASAHEGLVAIVDGGLTFWRASWGGSLLATIEGTPRGVTVVDSERVIIASDTGLNLVEVPLERPANVDDRVELPTVWSRPLAEGDPEQTSAGVVWKDVLLVESTDEVWAYPLDGGEPSPFLPSLGHHESFFPTLGYTHLGPEFVTAMARDPNNRDDFWLFRNSLGSEIEVLDTDIQGAPPLNTSGFISTEMYRWTPQLGRILYAVRDGNAVSIRQHVLTE